jgi:hypothetical protein
VQQSTNRRSAPEREAILADPGFRRHFTDHMTPVSEVKSAEHEWTVGTGTPGSITMRLRKAPLELQTRQAPDPHGWMHKLL